MASSPAQNRRTKKKNHRGFLKTIAIGAAIDTGPLGGAIHRVLFKGLKTRGPGKKHHHKEDVEFYKTILEDGAVGAGAVGGEGTGGNTEAANPAGPFAGYDKFLGKGPNSPAANTRKRLSKIVREHYMRVILEKKLKGKGKASAEIGIGTQIKVAKPPYHKIVEAKLNKKSIVVPEPLDKPKTDFTKIQNGDGRQI